MFSDIFNSSIKQKISREILADHSAEIFKILSKPKITFDDFLALISRSALPFLEQMAQRSRQLTLSRFGKTISLYGPLYVSNECVNTCTYCAFSRPNKITRRTLGFDEIKAEAKALRETGIRSVLLLTGESPKMNPVEYLLEATSILTNYFDSVQMEIYPLDAVDYQRFYNAGIEGVTVYQEAYNREIYDKVHLGGFKQDYTYRLDTAERVAQSGIRKIAIGSLLGLAPWREEIGSLAYHLQYLEKTAWRSSLSVSFPRIRDAAFAIAPEYDVSDKELVQIICAMRIFSHNTAISISTREAQGFRESLIPLGATHMSAGSRTDIGGYSGAPESTEQFHLEDSRCPREFAEVISSAGYDPVWKEWDTQVQSQQIGSQLP